MPATWFKDRKGIRVVVSSSTSPLTLVAAVAGKTYRVLRCTLSNAHTATTVALKFSDGTADLTGERVLVAGGMFHEDFKGGEPCQAANRALTIVQDQGGTVTIKGDVWYEEI